MIKSIQISCCIIVIIFSAGCAIIPGYSQAMQINELNKLKQVGIGCHLFANDNGTKLPEATTQLKAYLGDEFDFANVRLIEKNTKLPNCKKTGTTILAVSSKPLANKKYAALFVDGHCELISNEKYKKIANK